MPGGGTTAEVTQRMMESPKSPPGSDVGIPPARAEAPADSNRRTQEEDGTEKADGALQQLVGEVAALRKELGTREQAGKACVAEAKRRLAATNGRGADMLEDLFKHESKEEERFAMWKHVTEDLQEMAARRQRGEVKPPQELPGDGWAGMTGSLDSQMARFTSMVEAVGPSPSSIVEELRAQEADLEKEMRGPSRDLERRYQELVALKQRDVFEKRVGGSATTNNTSTGTDTNANTTTTTDTNTSTDANPKAKAKANVDTNTSSNNDTDTDNDTNTNANTDTNTDTDTSERSATATPSPSVGVLREEKRYLRKRVKVYDELTRRLLRVIDRRQAAADEGIRRSEEALVVCNARRTTIRVTIKRLLKEMAKVSARVEELQLAQLANHSPPANSITEEIANWEGNKFYKAFVEHVRAAAAAGGGGDSEGKDVFIAEEFLSAEKELYVRSDLLGEGGFGRVDKVSAFTPPEYFALKSLKTGMGEDSEEEYALLKTPRENLKAEMAVHCRLPLYANISQAKAMAMDNRDRAKLHTLFELGELSEFKQDLQLGGVVVAHRHVLVDIRARGNPTVEAKAIADHNSAVLQILFELGECDFNKHSWALTSTSLCELMGHMAGVAAGLVFLHEHGIGHNDLKPGNILLFKGEPGADLTAKLADFGLALAFGDLRNGQGSLGILPPEAILEKHLPCRPDQDVFALGHLILLIVAKNVYKSHNMWLSKAVRPKNYKQQQEKLDFAGRFRYMEKKTLRRMVSPYHRRKIFDPENITDELGDMKEEVLEMVDLATSADPTRRPSMKTVEIFATKIYKRLLENKVSSVAGPPSAPGAEEEGAGSEQSVPSTRSPVEGSNATTADIPSVEVFPAEETVGGSDGGGGSTGGSSVPVVAPANREGGVRQSVVGTVAGETAGLPETIIDGTVPPAATGVDAPAAVDVVAAAAPAAAASPAADPEQSALPARSSLGVSNTVCTDIPSVEVLPAGGDGSGGSTSGPSVPVVSLANRERGLHPPGVGTVVAETARLPETMIDGAAAAAAGVPAAAAFAAAATPAGAALTSAPVTSPAAGAGAAAAAAASAGATRNRDGGGCSGIGVGVGGGVGIGVGVGVGVGGDGSGDGGGADGPLAPVVTSVNCEGDPRQSELGTFTSETARLPEAVVDGASSPAAACAAAPVDVVSVAAVPPAAASASASFPTAVASSPAAAAADVTRSRNGGGGTCGGGSSGGVGGGGGGHGGGGGAGGSASSKSLPSPATLANVAEEIPACVSVEGFGATGECERQASAPGLVGSGCVVPSRISNVKAPTKEKGVVPPSRVGHAPDVCGGESCSNSRVADGAPVQAFQGRTSVARRASVTVRSTADDGDAARQAPCEGARRPARRTTARDGKRERGAEWLMQAIRKEDPVALSQKVAGAAAGGGGRRAARQAPCGKARRPARRTAGHDGKRETGAEWILKAIRKGDPATPSQRIDGTATGGDGGGGDVHYKEPSRVNTGEVHTTRQTAASPPPPRSHGVFNISHIVKAAVARLAPPPRREGGGAAASPLIPGSQVPLPSQAGLGWAGWGVFSGRGGVASAGGRAGERLDGGYSASTGRVADVAATREKTRQLASAWQAGVVRGPSYGGLAPHAYAPFGGFGGRAASPQQWPFVACGARGYLP